jgi:hypothetical protein
MPRLSLVTGQPFPTQDVAPTGTLFDTAISARRVFRSPSPVLACFDP